jgi:hypothetical protein
MRRSILYSLLLGLSLLLSCEKDDNSGLSGLIQPRIKKITDYNETGQIIHQYSFSYSGEKVVEILESMRYPGEILHITGRFEINYNGDEAILTAYQEKDGKLELSFKREYWFSKGRISIAEWYFWYFDTKWEFDYSYEYKYSSNGYLIKRFAGGVKRVFEYEEGPGNAKIFYYAPRDLVYGEPAF